MANLKTELTTLLGVQYPIISAPMATNAGGKLAGHVTAGGGFGFIGATVRPINNPNILQSEIDLAKSIANSTTFGVGFIAFILEFMGPAGQALVKKALDNGVKAIWFSFGEDDVLKKWVDFVQEHNRANNGNILVFVQVTSVDKAVKAREEWKADVVSIQSFEAGGHGPNDTPPLKSLVPSVKSALPKGSLVTAAGGLATGSDVAEILDLGADGVVLGTRFVLAPEGFYSDKHRQFMADAKGDVTVRSDAWDQVEGVRGKFPKGFDARGIKNQLVKDFDDGVDYDTLGARYKAAGEKEDSSYGLFLAGTGVGRMDRVLPAADIVKELAKEASESRKQ